MFRKLNLETLESRQMLSSNPGDFNGDFVVDDADLAAIAAQYDLPQSAVDALRDWQANYGAQYFDAVREPIQLPMGDIVPAVGNGGERAFGVLTGSYDKLIVPEGVTASIVGVFSAKELRVEGNLIFDPASHVDATVETLLVTKTGHLISHPQPDVTHMLGLGGSEPQDAQQMEQGLLVMGLISMQGESKQGPLTHVVSEWDTHRSITIYSTDPEHRGHIWIVGGAEYDIQQVRIQDMGRTTSDPLGPDNQIGRYALHLHHAKAGGQLIGNAIVGSEKWAIATHHTDGAVIQGNVIVGATGSGIAFESGLEMNNTVSGNFIGNIQGNGESPYSRPASEGGFAGDGIWLRGVGINNRVENNVMVDISGSGMAFFARFGNEEEIQANQMGSLWGNLVKNAHIGYSIYGVGEDFAVGPTNEYLNFRGLRAEDVQFGVETSYSGKLDLSGSSFVGRGGTGIGIKAGSPEWLLLDDVTVTGFQSGLQSNVGFTVRDGYWDNLTNIQYTGNVLGRAEGFAPYWLRHEDIEIYQPTWGPNSETYISLPEIEPPGQRFRNYAWQQNVVYTDDDGQRWLLFRDGQQPEEALPTFPDSRTAIEEWQTNAQMWESYRMAFLGRLMPETADYTTKLGYHAPAPEDITPPLAFNTTSERLADGRLAIRWQTDEPATSQVEWAVGELKTTEWATFTELDAELKTEHEVIIDAPVGRIAFMRYSADATGNLQQMYRVGGFSRRAFTHKD